MGARVIEQRADPTSLTRVTIENWYLIEGAELVFADRFTVCTGETGSGKTMVLGALQFACGARADAGAVRRGAERARVTLGFASGSVLAERAAAAGFALDPGEDGAIVREVSAVGRSMAQLNGRPVTAAQLREITGGAIETVGQHDQSRLLDAGRHAGLLDRFGGTEHIAARSAVRTAVQARDAAYAELQALERRSEADQRDVAGAERLLEEIDAVDPQPDEDVHLRLRRDQQQHAQRIREALDTARAVLLDDDSAVMMVGGAVANLQSLERFGATFAELSERVTAVQSELQDVGLSIARELQAFDGESDADAESIAQRADAIEKIKRRYGGSIAAVLLARQDAQALLDRVGDGGADIARATATYLERESAAWAAAKILSDLRRSAADRLILRLEEELQALAIRAPRIEIRLTPLAAVAMNGAERVEFLFSANVEREPAPLAECASGGELSRILLAFTAATAGVGPRSTILFDEIDAGIGGATARAVGERLSRLAERAQVVCITHSAQIAARADVHFVLSKVDAGRTQIAVTELDAQARIGEIARMLSGSDTGTAREHAAELFNHGKTAPTTKSK